MEFLNFSLALLLGISSFHPTMPLKNNQSTEDTVHQSKSISTGGDNTKNITPSNISSKEYNWYFNINKDKLPPTGPKETISFTPKYDVYHLGDTSKKVLYLTFDEGYENGYTIPILDILKKQNVKAAFFVVKPYITSQPEIVKRMLEDGHLVCNHTSHHPSMASITNQATFNKEFSDVEDAYEKLTGKKMPKFFRPPMGKYSELSLFYTKCYGYKTIFWSFAYNDWDRTNQPELEYAKKRILNFSHNGGIILLHAVSKTNATILDEVITEWKKEGFEFKTLDELP